MIPPSGSGWMHEIKHDGYRTASVIDAGTVRIFTRRGHDWAARMPGIAEALRVRAVDKFDPVFGYAEGFAALA